MNSNKYFISITIMFVALGCDGQGQKAVEHEKKGGIKNALETLVTDTIAQANLQPSSFYSIQNTIGVVMPVVKGDIKKPLSIYNKDGSVWKQMAFEGVLKKNLAFLFPFAKDEDTYLLAFKCLKKAGNYYEIVIDEQKQTIKYIDISDKSFDLIRWQDYIINCFSVQFDVKSNPLRMLPSSKAKTISYNADEFYHPVKIEGEWLQVKWGDNDNWSYGWIKWEKEGSLIIELFNNA